MESIGKNIERFPDIMAAFYAINSRLLFTNSTATIVHAYNWEFELEPVLAKEVDYTRLVNYTAAKWGGLISNYLDFSSLGQFTDRVVDRIGKKHWAETMQFSHNTKSRQACLISATASNNGLENTLFLHVRTSETYKRLSLDLLLFKRIGDMLFGSTPYILRVYINHLWLSTDWASMLLVKKTLRQGAKHADIDSFASKAYDKYLKFKGMDWKSLTYNSHKRPCRVIQKDVHSTRLTSSDCYLV